MKKLMSLFITVCMLFSIANMPAAASEPDTEISVTPDSITMYPGGVYDFSAVGSMRSDVIWYVHEGARGGMISQEGSYMAPDKEGTYHIIAALETDRSKFAATAVTVVKTSATVTDFGLAASDISVTGLVKPGNSITLKAKVHNLGSENIDPGGSVVRFLIDEKIIDEIPFYMSKDDNYKNVTVSYILPEGPYSGLQTNQQIPLRIQAIVDPGGGRIEKNESNNTGIITVNLKGDGEKPLDDTGPKITVSSSDLTAYSSMDSAANDRVNAALPGTKLTLKAKLHYAGSDSYENINVRFYINNVLIKNDYRKFYKPGSGKLLEVSAEYMVPNNCSEALNYRVELDSGYTGYMTIPIVPWDFSVTPSRISWTSNAGISKPAVAGKNITFAAVLNSCTGLESTNDYRRVCVRFLLDGKIISEKWHSLTGNADTFVSDNYTLPANLTEPLRLTVIADPYGLFPENNKGNNIASLEIPISQGSNLQPDFSINSDGLSYAPMPLIPGSRIDLSASIKNNSWAVPGKALKVYFKINGQKIHDFSIARNLLRPGQSYTVTKTWTVPAGQTSDPVFEVVLDPFGAFAGENVQDNQATVTMPLARPDLEVSAADLSCSPEVLTAGSTGILKALIHNSGLTAVKNSMIKFFIDDTAVGQKTITVPANSSIPVDLNYIVPSVSQLNVPVQSLSGESGYRPAPPDMSSSIQFRVEADPDGLIPEIDETNNNSPQLDLNVMVPGEKATLYVRVSDSVGNVSDARVKYTSVNGAAVTIQTADGYCTFFGVPFGGYSLEISKAGYDTLTVNGSVEQGRTIAEKHVVLIRNDQMGDITEADSDGDTMPDSSEIFYGTGINDPDSDGDGVVDGKDISPGMDPFETAWTEMQRPGMVRTSMNVKGYGLDGWVDVYDIEYHLLPPSTSKEFSQSYEDEGTKKSEMTGESFKKALDILLDEDWFEVWKVDDITPADINVPDLEFGHDRESEFNTTYQGDALHPTEYRFYYDQLTDYRKVYLKNTQEMLYPYADNYFRYILAPVKMKKNKEQTVSIQFRDTDAYKKMSFTDDDHYSLPAFMYSYHQTDNFADDSNKLIHEGMAVTSVVSENVFEVSIILPEEKALYDSGWLKLTPVMVEKNGNETGYSPLNLSDWDMTGLTRSVVHSKDSTGNSITVYEELQSLYALNGPIIVPDTIRQQINSPNVKFKDEWIGIITRDENVDNGNYRVSDITQKTINIIDKTGNVLDRISTLVENAVKEVNKVEEISDLPPTHWARSAKYNNVLSGIAAVGGVVSMATNGEAAWAASRKGEYVEVAYYSAKTVTSGMGTAVSLANISKNTLGTAGKAGKFAKLTGKKVAVGLAIAVGVIEVSYDIYRLNATNDKILKMKYKEKIEGDVIDTGISVAGVFFVPVLAFHVTWAIGVELYSLFRGEDFAYKVASSEGSAFVFLRKYFITEGVPSQMAEEAYDSSREKLIEVIELHIGSRLPYLEVFIDPDI